MGIRRRRYEEARAQYALRRMDSRGELGNIVITLRLPDGSTRRHRFWQGTPKEALVALVLESDWAKANQPSAVSFFTGFPRKEVDQEGDIDSHLHGATLCIRERFDTDDNFEVPLSSCCSQADEEETEEETDEPEEEEALKEQSETLPAPLPSLLEVASRPLRRLASYQGSVLSNHAGACHAEAEKRILNLQPSTEQLFDMPWPTIPSK